MVRLHELTKHALVLSKTVPNAASASASAMRSEAVADNQSAVYGTHSHRLRTHTIFTEFGELFISWEPDHWKLRHHSS